MSRYICVDKLIDSCDRIINYGFANSDGKHYISAEWVKKKIEIMEATNVRENIHGEWDVDEHLLRYAPFHECKKCGEQMYITHDNFCPNCGVDMRKEVKE